MEKIFLVICTGYLGDVVLTSKLIKDIHKNFSSAKILYICDTPYVSVAQNLPFVNDVFGYDRKKEFTIFRIIKFYLDFPYKNKITHAFIIHENKKSRRFLSKVLGSKNITAWEDYRYSDFNKKLLAQDSKYENTAYLNANMLSVLTQKPTDDENIEFIVPEITQKKMKNYLKSITDKNIILLSPNCKDKEKSWEPGEFIKLVYYINKTGYMPLLTGISNDGREYLEALQSNKLKENVDFINMTDKTNFEELGALCKISTLVISIDTGTAHLASAVGADSIVLFFRNDTNLWKPIDSKKNTTISKSQITCNDVILKIKYTLGRIKHRNFYTNNMKQ